MFLLAGLGNIGAKYDMTRHNIGFMAADAMIEAHPLTGIGTKFHSDCFKGKIAAHDVILIKPQTFMNKSGVAVGEAARFYKIPPEKVIVFYDDLDLVPGKCRIKKNGGHGGHNGLRDIDRAIGKDYWRVRIGIDHPGRKEQVISYVLGRFSTDEQIIMERSVNAIAKHIPLMLDGSYEKLMTAVALEMQS